MLHDIEIVQVPIAQMNIRVATTWIRSVTDWYSAGVTDGITVITPFCYSTCINGASGRSREDPIVRAVSHIVIVGIRMRRVSIRGYAKDIWHVLLV